MFIGVFLRKLFLMAISYTKIDLFVKDTILNHSAKNSDFETIFLLLIFAFLNNIYYATFRTRNH